MIRLTGFGPFGEVQANPSERLVRAFAGRQVAGHPVEVRVLPVRWRDGLDDALRGPAPSLLLGFGVAVDRPGVQVERWGTPVREGRDIDHQLPGPAPHPDPVQATVDLARLAAALDAEISDDAGTFLCNAWAHQVVSRAPCPAVFVHLPAAGLHPDRLLRGLRAYLSGKSSPGSQPPRGL